MIFLDIQNKLSEIVDFEKVNDNEYTIKTKAKLLNGKNIDLKVLKDGSKFYLTDNKLTLKYMNELYELKSADVKSCIGAVLKIYNFSMSAGEIKVEIRQENNISSMVFDMIMCIGQLANMYAFFEKPE